MRTTSSLEAINSVIQRSFPGQTNIYKFIESLRLYESRKSEDLYKMSTSGISNRQLERKRAVDKEREEKILYFTTQLKNGEISTSLFLESMSGKDVLPPVGKKCLKILNVKRIIIAVQLNNYVHSKPQFEPTKIFAYKEQKD